MTSESRKMSGIILLTVPTIVYGGYFLLSLLSGQHQELALTTFQKAMFRAGHAHAGVLVMLALLVQLLVDEASLSKQWKWLVRSAFPLAAILISGGFFASAAGKGLTEPNALIVLLYLGITVLVGALLALGMGLVRESPAKPG